MAVVNGKERHQQRRSTYRDSKLVHVRECIMTCDRATTAPPWRLPASSAPALPQLPYAI